MYRQLSFVYRFFVHDRVLLTLTGSGSIYRTNTFRLPRGNFTSFTLAFSYPGLSLRR